MMDKFGSCKGSPFLAGEETPARSRTTKVKEQQADDWS